MLETAWFDYDLPEELIARYPAPRRDESRMLVLDRCSGEAQIHPFRDVVDYLNPGDLLVCNNTRVLPGRMFAVKAESGARFELLLLEPCAGVSPAAWNVLLKPGKRAKTGVRAVLLDRKGRPNSVGDFFTVDGKNADGSYRIVFSSADIERLHRCYGHIPLPPYLNRDAEAEDEERYQTVYASAPGAVAAPTAGLHFTREVLSRISARGVGIAELTLHVGAGTFKPVSSEHVEEHKMHFEEFWLPDQVAEQINAVHAAGRKVMAVGTTTVRVLESCAAPDGGVSGRHDRTDIFLYPPYRIRAVDMLLTNFHLPKSTLLMLVSCFCDREKVLAAYELAKREKMRFYSYGDCMLLK